MAAVNPFLGVAVLIVAAFTLSYAVYAVAHRRKPVPPPDLSAFPALTQVPYDTARPYPRPCTGELDLDRICPGCGMEDPARMVKDLLGWPAHRTCTELFGDWRPGQCVPEPTALVPGPAQASAGMVPYGPGGAVPGATDRPWSTAELPGQGRLAVRAWGENGVPDYRWRCLCGATAYGTARTPELAHANAVDGLGDHRRSGECR
jgi:hypothetical protein